MEIESRAAVNLTHSHRLYFSHPPLTHDHSDGYHNHRVDHHRSCNGSARCNSSPISVILVHVTVPLPNRVKSSVWMVSRPRSTVNTLGLIDQLPFDWDRNPTRTCILQPCSTEITKSRVHERDGRLCGRKAGIWCHGSRILKYS